MSKYAIVLAAGKGTRMKSEMPKVIHPVCGLPMIQHIINNLKKCGIDEIYVVVGHKSTLVKAVVQSNVKFVEQVEQYGTAHAVSQVSKFLKGKKGTTIILSGDTPLITDSTISSLIDEHRKSNAKGTVLTANLENPFGYGRIVKEVENNSFHIKSIVEEKDASPEEKMITEINSGIYAFDNESLFTHLSEVSNQNQQSEYYLTDLVAIFKQHGEKFISKLINDHTEILGVNDRVQLAIVTKLMQGRINTKHMLNGVTIIDPVNTYIDDGVTIGEDTIIYPGVALRGRTHIGKNCIIRPNIELLDTTTDDDSEIISSSA